MFRNYLKTAYRNLRKSKVSSLINILGLTAGISCCLLIGLYIRHEMSYDNFQENREKLARVIMAYKFDGGDEFKRGNFTSVRVAPLFKKTFPEVKESVRMYQAERIIGFQDKLFSEKRFMFADPSFFSMFSFKMLAGDPATALDAPHTMVLTESTAKKYFGTTDSYLSAVGQSIRLVNDSIPYKVTGVLQDYPDNSQIKFDMLASFSSLGFTAKNEDTYWNANYTTYFLLNNTAAFKTLQEKIPPFMKREMEGKGASVNFELEPFSEIHLHSPYGGFEPNNSMTYIYILAAVALLILVIVCSTYINLSTARSMERAREVGIRKVIGAGRTQLFRQFLGESFILCLVALALSIGLVALLLPAFNNLCERSLQWQQLLSPAFLITAILLIAFISFAAGFYPALIIAGFQPVKVLKGAFKNTSQAQWLRKSLVVFQFTISIFLIVATFIVQQQLHFIQHRKLGFDRDHVLVLTVDSKTLKNMSVIKQEFKSNPDIISLSCASRSPVNIIGGYNMRSAVMPANAQLAVTANPIDEDYIKTTGLQLLYGSDLNEQDVKNSTTEDSSKKDVSFILNESAARQLGWTPETAVGQRMFLDDSRPGHVKGVIKDFHFESMQNAIKPLVLFPEDWGRVLMIKMSGQHLPQTIAFLESKWKTLAPTRPFEYHFLDDDFNKLYSSELRLGRILNLFASVAILLACLGLFGLSSYATQQRTKEIGIRKILGASVGSLWVLLSTGFLWLVLIAFLAAAPLAWMATHQWLMSYEYRAPVSWWPFIAAGLGALLLTMATVSLQSIRSALMNPVKGLRTE